VCFLHFLRENAKCLSSFGRKKTFQTIGDAKDRHLFLATDLSDGLETIRDQSYEKS